jgi:catechol 2,3-dioxygenase-like lactoylglutathione lyase family enzyme
VRAALESASGKFDRNRAARSAGLAPANDADADHDAFRDVVEDRAAGDGDAALLCVSIRTRARTRASAAISVPASNAITPATACSGSFRNATAPSGSAAPASRPNPSAAAAEPICQLCQLEQASLALAQLDLVALDAIHPVGGRRRAAAPAAVQEPAASPRAFPLAEPRSGFAQVACRGPPAGKGMLLARCISHSDKFSHWKETSMLANRNAVANLAVRNIDTARKFYESTLGLKRVGDEGPELIVFRSGNTTINVYQSEKAGTNQATAVTWMVGDELESVVRDLKAKGVSFEHYDMPDMQRQGDVYVAGDMKVAWFKDPDGNILNIASR